MSYRRKTLFVLIPLFFLLLAVLACEDTTGIYQQAFFVCGTATMDPNATNTPTEIPGGPTYTPWPSPEPYVRTDGFYLYQKVFFADLEMKLERYEAMFETVGSETEDTQAYHYFDLFIKNNGEEAFVWDFATWSTIRTLNLYDAGSVGAQVAGNWGISEDAASYAGFSYDDGAGIVSLQPGEETVLTLAYATPHGSARDLELVFAPQDAEASIDDYMPGSNSVTFLIEEDSSCRWEVTTEPLSIDGIDSEYYYPTWLPPVNARYGGSPTSWSVVMRGYGCSNWWTGRQTTSPPCYEPDSQGRYWWHTGIDLGAQMGTPLYSIVEGTVIHAGDTPYQSPEYYCGEDDREGYMDYPPYGFGHYVTIETADHTCRVYYAHMQRGSIQVSVGDSVEPGTLLGGMGGTGCSWGVHLHLEVRCLNNGKYEVVDPGIFMGGRTGGYD